MNILTAIKLTIEQEPPSILEQTQFNCGFFDFGRAKQDNVCFFNCGIVERPDGLWLVTRRARNWNDNLGFNDVVAFRMKDKTPIKGYALKFLKSFADQHYEDPRAIWHNGYTYVSTTTFLIYGAKRWSRAHQTLSVLNDQWQAIRQVSVHYGNNRKDVLGNVGMEKNWLWFFHENRLHMVYSTYPHVVVPLDDDLKPGKSYTTHAMHPDWIYGEPRGGTPPVRVGNEYWTFYHSSVPWINKKRRYSIGACAFEATQPFQIKRMTPKPILIGSKFDPWDDKKPACVFACGAIIRDGTWLITLGVNDLNSAWIEVPHKELVKLTEPVIPQYELISSPA